MKITIILFFVITIFLSNDSYSQFSFDFETDSLHVVWGEKNYTGKNDCSAEVSLNSDGEKIKIVVNVVDDKLVLTDDPLHSDHIELWFSLPDVKSDKYIISDSTLYLIKGEADLQKFQTFLSDPMVYSFETGIDSFYYSQMDSIGYDWLKPSIDRFLSDAYSSNLYVSKVPFGLVHFGILPNLDDAIQYDQSLYTPIENFTKTKFADLTKHISFTKRISENGYSLEITIYAKALGFITKYGIEEIKFLVDVVDVDSGSKQETLLSTSENRVWGDKSTFNDVTFKKRIDVNIFGIPKLGTKQSFDSPYDKVIVDVSKYFVNSSLGWVPVDIHENTFYSYNQPEVYRMDDIYKIQFKKGMLNYRKELVNGNTIEYLTCSNDSYVILNNKNLFIEKEIIKQIYLPNGKLAFLYSEFDITGRYTKQITSFLYLVTDSFKQVIASYLYPNSLDIDYKDIYIKEKWDYDRLYWNYGNRENIKWSNVIEYNQNDQFLIIKLSDSLNYKVEWDEVGKLLKK